MRHESAKVLLLHLLGPFRASMDGADIILPVRAQALLALLATRGGQISRAEAAGMLWSDRAEDQARANVRVVLTRLRKQLPGALTADRSIIRLDSPVVSDLDALELGDIERLITEVSGPFLVNHTLDDTLYDDWVRAERVQIEQQVLKLALESVDKARATQDWLACSRYAAFGLTLDPWHEALFRELLVSTFELRGRFAAEQVLIDFRTRLTDDLGQRPSYETIKLAGELGLQTADKSDALVPVADIKPRPAEEAERAWLALLREGRVSEAVAAIDHHQRTHSELDPGLARLELIARTGDLVALDDLDRLPTPPVPDALQRPTALVERSDVVGSLTGAGGPGSISAGLVLLPGAAGSGKSTAMRMAADAAHALGRWVLLGRCDGSEDDPFQPVREILSDLVKALPQSVLVEHVSAHGGEIGQITDELARRVELPAVADGDAIARRSSLHRAVIDLLERASAIAPLFILVDDVHWASESSLDLLVQCATDARSARYVAAFRHNEPDQDPVLRSTAARLVRLGAETPPPMGHFDGCQLRDLVVQMGGDPTLADTVMTETSGHPLYSAQLVRHLSDNGESAHEASQRRGREDVPQALRDVIWQRVAALPASATEVLTTAAALGESFSINEVMQLCTVDEEVVLDALDAAERVELIAAVELDEEFAFDHEIVRRSLLDELSEVQRRRLHLNAAELAERRLAAIRPGPTRARAVSKVARHSLGTRNAERIWTWAPQAGEAAEYSLNPAEAAEWFRLALEHADAAGASDDEKLKARIDMGRNLTFAGAPSSRAELLEAGHEAIRQDNPERLVQTALLTSRGFQLRHDPQRTEVIEKALAAVTTTDHADAAVLAATLAMELQTSRRWSQVDELVDRALQHAASANDAGLSARVAALCSNALWRPGQLERRRQLCRDASAAASRVADPAERFHIAWAAHGVAIESGDADAALRHRAELSEIASENPNRQAQWPLGMVESFWTTMTGDLEVAEQTVHDSFALGSSFQEPDAFEAFAMQFMVVRSYSGEIEELVPLVEAAASVPDAAPATVAAHAIICARTGRETEAQATLDAATARGFSHVAPNFMWVSSMLAYAIIANEVSDTSAADALSGELLPYADEVAFSGMTSQGSVSLQVGRLCQLLGRFGQARELLHNALDVHRRLGWPVYEASACVALGDLDMCEDGALRPETAALIVDAAATSDKHGFGPLQLQISQRFGDLSHGGPAENSESSSTNTSVVRGV